MQAFHRRRTPLTSHKKPHKHHPPKPPKRATTHLKRRVRIGLFVLLFFVIIGTILLWFVPSADYLLLKHPLRHKRAAVVAPHAVRDARLSANQLSKFLPAATIEHIRQTNVYIYKSIDPDTHLAASFPGDDRLHNWSVVYDNAMRVIMQMNTGDIDQARKTMDYFISNTAIRKVGWIHRNNEWVPQPGWIVNIVDAGQARTGGRGIEHVAHVGPNAYLGLAALHLYQLTHQPRYLDFARERWRLIKNLQNENPRDFNFGGVRMGPRGDPRYPQEQRLNFDRNNPSYYELYNGEHAADFKAFSELMSLYDPKYRDRYKNASRLIEKWDHKIYDRKNHLFYMGTSEKAFFDENVAQWFNPGVIYIHPLDTSALKISAYGVKSLEQFEKNAAEKIREAIERNFRVTVVEKNINRTVRLSGYDFVTGQQRKSLVLMVEEGERGDEKVKKGVGRDPMLTDEWSTWVAFADLRLASDFEAMGEFEKSVLYFKKFEANALVEGIKGAVHLSKEEIAYPYAHPLPYALNKPVGFGWNTHHNPYSMIGGVARTLGLLRFDPFQFCGGRYAIKTTVTPARLNIVPLAQRKVSGVLYTEAEEYLQDAWEHVKTANQRGADEEQQWTSAVQTIERMTREHPDWSVIAVQQNELARRSEEKYPLKGVEHVEISDLEPVYRNYWALYHVGTGEFIRVIAYSNLAHLAGERGDAAQKDFYKKKMFDAATLVRNNYPFAQAYDESGWMWQPVDSLREYTEQ